MNFKKDLSKLAYIAGDWKGKLVTVEYTDQEIDREISLFMNWVLWITTEIFNTELAIDMLDLISRKYKAKQLEEGKATEVTYGDEFYSKIIKETISEWTRYLYKDFDRYQDDNITAENETIWMSLWFLSKIQKLFEEELQYIFKWDYIVWVTAYTAVPLFIVWWVKMPRQLNLLTWSED